jgi:hypothetical protein
VKVFFDECVPRPLRHHLPNHEIKTAQELGWGRLHNGELISRAEESGFEIFVTGDKNLSYQQNLKGRRIALLVLSTNYWPTLRQHPSRIEAQMIAMQPGGYVELSF